MDNHGNNGQIGQIPRKIVQTPPLPKGVDYHSLKTPCCHLPPIYNRPETPINKGFQTGWWQSGSVTSGSGHFVTVTDSPDPIVTTHLSVAMAGLLVVYIEKTAETFGETYYDHALTKMEKNNLLRSIDEIKRPFASKETTDDESRAFDILSEFKDKRLISILQIK